MTLYTIVWVSIGVVVILGIGMAIWVCIAEYYEKKMKRKSVSSIIDRKRDITK